MPYLIETENIDGPPVLVSSGGNSKFFGILELMSSTGAETVEAVLEFFKTGTSRTVQKPSAL